MFIYYYHRRRCDVTLSAYKGRGKREGKREERREERGEERREKGREKREGKREERREDRREKGRQKTLIMADLNPTFIMADLIQHLLWPI